MRIFYLFGYIICLIAACNIEPEKIDTKRDSCAHCKMKINELTFATQIITGKGKSYKFDDMFCMLSFLKNDIKSTTNSYTLFVVDNCSTENWIVAEKAIFLSNENFKSPMGGNTIGFSDSSCANYSRLRDNSIFKRWKDIYK